MDQFRAHLLGHGCESGNYDENALDPDMPWHDVGKKARNKLLNTLLNDVYAVRGKTTFKEEFVTCGGVTLGELCRHVLTSAPWRATD